MEGQCFNPVLSTIGLRLSVSYPLRRSGECGTAFGLLPAKPMCTLGNVTVSVPCAAMWGLASSPRGDSEAHWEQRAGPQGAAVCWGWGSACPQADSERQCLWTDNSVLFFCAPAWLSVTKTSWCLVSQSSPTRKVCLLPPPTLVPLYPFRKMLNSGCRLLHLSLHSQIIFVPCLKKWK